MAVNCEPVLASLGLSAYFAVNQFLQRLRDPQSRAFFDSNHDKISRFYRNCQDAIRLLNENNPERRERLKRVLNGPVIFLFYKTCKDAKLHVAESQRPPLSEEEFAQASRTWAFRTTVYVQSYLARVDFDFLTQMINMEGEMELIISEADMVSEVGFQCGLTKA